MHGSSDTALQDDAASGQHSRSSREHADGVVSTRKEKEHRSEGLPQKRKTHDNILSHTQSQLEQCQAHLEQCADKLAVQQAKYDSLVDELRRLQNKNDCLRLERDEVRRHRDFYAPRYAFIVRKYLLPYARHLDICYDDTDDSAMKELLRPLIADAMEATSLRAQVQLLQKELLSNVEKVHATSDEQFAQDFRALSSGIKALSRMTSLNDKVDIFDVLGAPILVQDVLPHHWAGRGKKRSFVEAYLWSILLEMVFHNPFIMFGESFGIVHPLWQEMFGPAKHHGMPVPAQRSEIWRYTTVERLAEMTGPGVLNIGKTRSADNHPEGMAARTLAESANQARTDVADAMLTGLEQISSAVDVLQIRNIVDMAFGLSLQMSLQRCRVQITFPRTGASFVKEEMSYIPDDDGEERTQGIVAFVINPGLTKWGDARGKNLDQRYDIVPTLVQLEPEVVEDGSEVSLI